ncbi:hypothetical protein D3C76_1289160 [compost metagenome]
MDGEHGGCAQAAPGHVGRGQGRGPVVGVDQFRAPADAGGSGGDLGGRQAQASEANMVVGPVVAMAVAVGCAFALVELGADQQIDDQPVRQIQAADPTRGQGGEAADLADDTDRQAGFQHLPVTGDQYADVVARGQGLGQGRRHVAEAAHLDQVGEFGCDEQDALLAGLQAAQAQVGLGLGAGGCDLFNAGRGYGSSHSVLRFFMVHVLRSP